MTPVLRRIGTAFYLSLTLVFLRAATPDLAVDPRILAFGPATTPLTLDAFASIALIASGAEGETLVALESRLSDAAADLRSMIPNEASEEERAETALTFLYGRFLKRYSEFQTRVDLALTSGEYNCVSASVLYYYFASVAGLAVEGVETPIHSFCTVQVRGAKIDVETTNPYGYNPGAQKELPSGSVDAKRYVIVPQTNYRERRPISERRLLALIYNNRLTLLERQGNYEQVMPLALAADALQGTEESARDVDQRFVNYAIQLSRQGRYQEGIDFILNVSANRAKWPVYAEYIDAAASAYLSGLMDRGQYPTAFAFLETYGPSLSPATLKSINGALHYNFLQIEIDRLGLADALEKITSAKQNLERQDHERLVVYAYSREGERVAAGKTWLEAAAVAERGLAELPGQSDLIRQRNVYRQNFAIDAHNKAAAAFNAGKKDAARQIIEEALVAVPENTMLKNDLQKFK